MLLHPFMRRLVEVVFDGKPEAVGDVESAAANYHAFVAKERQRLTVPARKDEVSKLADHYSSSPLGDLRVERQGAHTTGGVPNLCCRRNGWFGVSRE
jgi:hypothetical protein